MPMNTPVRLPRRLAGSIPASSRACQLVSSSIRCCGSSSSASTGAMPKNAASKRSRSETKPPRIGSLPSPSARNGRSAGASLTRLAPVSSRSQKESTFPAPGKRQAMPTTAIRWSSLLRRTATRRSVPHCPRSSCSATWRASTVAFVWSKATVLGTAQTPWKACFSRLRNSTAISESMPRSKKPVVGEGGSGNCRTACTSP